MRRPRVFTLLSLIFILIAINLPLHHQSTISAQVDNQGGFHEILRLGRGSIHNVEWHPIEPLILVDTARGAWLYDDTLADVGSLPDIRLARFSPDGKYIAGVNLDQGIEIWEAVTQNHLMTLAGHKNYVTTLEWNPDSQTLATGDESGSIIVWSATNGDKLNGLDAESEIYDLRWNPLGQHFAVFNNTGIFLGNKQANSALELLLDVYYLPFDDYHFNWINDEILIYSRGQSDSSCCSHIIHIVNKEVESNILWGGYSIALNSTKADFATSHWGDLNFYDMSNFEKYRYIPPDQNHGFYFSELSWSPDGQFLAAGKTLVENVENYSLISIYDKDLETPIAEIDGHRYGVYNLIWNHDNRRLLTTDGQGILRIVDIQTQAILVSRNFGQTSNNFSISLDEQYIAVADYLGNVVVYDIASGQQISRLEGGHTEPVSGILWRPSSQYWSGIPMIATYATTKRTGHYTSDKTVNIWNGLTGERLYSYEQFVVDAAWRPDGRILLTGGAADIAFWSALSGRLWMLDFHTELNIDRSIFRKPVGWSTDGTYFMIEHEIGSGYYKSIFNFPDITPFVARYRIGGGHSCFSHLEGWRNSAWIGVQMPCASTQYAYNINTITIMVLYSPNSPKGFPDITIEAPANQMVLSNDGTKLATYSRSDDVIRIWDTYTGKELLVVGEESTLLGDVEVASYDIYEWSADDHYLSIHMADGISIISTTTGEIIDTIPYLFDNRYYQTYEWSSNNRYFVMQSAGFISVWGWNPVDR